MQGCGEAVGVAGIVYLWTSSKRLPSAPEKSGDNSGPRLFDRSLFVHRLLWVTALSRLFEPG